MLLLLLLLLLGRHQRLQQHLMAPARCVFSLKVNLFSADLCPARGLFSLSRQRPVARLCKPGQCAFGSDWQPTPLLARQAISHNVFVLKFGLKDPIFGLRLSTCACILARGGGGAGGGELIVRPYTPVSTNAMRGSFEIMVKCYDEGGLSHWLCRTLAVRRELK